MREIKEKPAEEMARLIRVIGGKATAGEKDEQLRARAARRLGVTGSRAKVLWYGQTSNVRADEMDRARELAFVQPIEEAINAVESAERFLEGLRERLARRAGALGGDRIAGIGRADSHRASDREAGGPEVSSDFPGLGEFAGRAVR